MGNVLSRTGVSPVSVLDLIDPMGSMTGQTPVPLKKSSEENHSPVLVQFLLVAALVLKLVGTCLTLGSGGSGGVFAPSLFM